MCENLLKGWDEALHGKAAYFVRVISMRLSWPTRQRHLKDTYLPSKLRIYLSHYDHFLIFYVR